MMFKKGQAAMEFLMTYGWAILVVLIAIGALAYFGVLNPGRFLPSSCTISNQIGCSEFKVGTDSVVILVLQNGRGVNLNGVQPGLNVQSPTGTSCAMPAAQTINDGQSATFTFTACSPALSTTPGTKFKADLAITYTDAGSILGPRNATGTLTTKSE